MTPSAVRVAYNCFMFISMIVAFIFNICAILGDNWIEGEREGELIHDGLWVTCENSKCLKFSDTKVVLSGNLFLQFLLPLLLLTLNLNRLNIFQKFFHVTREVNLTDRPCLAFITRIYFIGAIILEIDKREYL